MPDLVLRQPDRRSCGAAVLVRARMLADPGYDRWLRSAPDPAARFGDEALRTHRRTNRWPPWPRALGTTPWGLAAELPGRVELVRDRTHAWDRLTRAGAPAALYVGTRLLPRHVVLVLRADADRARVYEPASGATLTLSRGAFLAGTLALAGWDRPWFTVVPLATR